MSISCETGCINKMKHSNFHTPLLSHDIGLSLLKNFTRDISIKLLVTPLFLLALFFASDTEASNCLTGDCHTNLGSTKYLHGPVAAEKAGAKGCVTCHVPDGKPCTKKGKGVYKILAPASLVCQICHTRGTGTQHSRKKIDCLKCHDPHGSDKSSSLKR